MSPYPILLVAILLAAAEPQFAGTATARGWVEQCQLAGWSADGPAWVDSAGKQIFDVVRWGGGATRITEQAVVLVDGSVLVGQVERFTREHLLIKGTTIQVQPIPWESVLVVVFTAGASVEDLRAWSAWATKLGDTTDHVMRNNGSTATGKLKLQIGDNATWMRGAPNLILESVPPQETDQPAANSAGGKSQDLELPIREIACFAPSPALRATQAAPPTQSLYLADGTSVHAARVGANASVVTACGAELKISAERQWWKVVRGWIDRSSTTWLARAKPLANVSQTPVGPLARVVATRANDVGFSDQTIDRQLLPIEFTQRPISQTAFAIPASAKYLLGEVLVRPVDGSPLPSMAGQIQFRVLTGPSPRQLVERWQVTLAADELQVTPLAVPLTSQQIPGEGTQSGNLLVLAVSADDAAAYGCVGHWLDLRWSNQAPE